MKVSIVTNSFNQGSFLEDAILSVLSQANDDLEYIVVDPGSADGSRDIIEKHASRINRIILEPDGGPADGLNKGFRAATGELLSFLNADDILLPDAVSRVVEAFHRYPEADVIYFDGLMIDASKRYLRRALSMPWSLVGYAYGACLMFQPGSFYRRDAFWRVGGFNTDNKTCWDGELLVDIALSGGNIIYREGYTAKFRFHPDSITGSGRLRATYEADIARIRGKIFHSLGINKSWITAIAYKARRYMTRPQTILEKCMAMIRVFFRKLNERGLERSKV